MAENDQVLGQSIKIDGKEYAVDDLSDTAKSQIVNMRYVDKQIEEAKNQLTMLQAARQFYASQLAKELSDEA